MIVLDPLSPQWAQRLVKNVEEELQRLRSPKAPTRLAVFESASDLPPAASWPRCMAWSLTNGLVVSDGTNWFPVTVGAAL